MKALRILINTVVIGLIPIVLFAKPDSLIFNGGNVIVGEIKSMNKGVLTIETDYSDSDFTIDWEKITGFYSEQSFTIALTDHSLLPGVHINSINKDSVILTGYPEQRILSLKEIVYIRQLKNTFWDRISVSFDISYSLTKANNLKQFSARGNLGYTTENWILNTTYSQVRSTQDDVIPTRRMDASVSGSYQLRNGIFFGTSINLLSNTEQLIDLRTTAQVGGGYFFFRDLDWYLNGFLGVAINNETYRPDPETMLTSDDRNSMEGVIGSELSMYDIGDINVFSNIYYYPSITEAGRNRVDFRCDISYDVFLDFYIKAGLTLNYDSRPAPGASVNDYVFLTGLGWKP